MSKKSIALVLALVLLVGCVAGGTLAWLTAETDEVTNTFTVGNINIDLTEHKLVDGKLSDTETTPTNAYDFVPGDTLDKDPYVTVKKDSEACYLFVKITEENNTVTGLDGKVINWSANLRLVSGDAPAVTWTKYATGEGVEVWYGQIPAVSADASWYILNENKVTVNNKITKDMADSMVAPSLSFDAAAVQSDNIGGADAAWDELTDTWTAGLTKVSATT